MPAVTVQSPAPPPRAPFSALSSGLLIAILVSLAYATSFRGVFVFDDHYSIVANPTIRELNRLDQILAPGPEAGTVAGRPLVNLSLALNHALSGLDPWSYHAVNLLVHVAAAITLAGLLRQTFTRGAGLQRYRNDSAVLAVLIALLWSLHPLQTQSVTYVVQRAESLMALCYLITLACFARGVGSPRQRWWFTASVAACLFGMGTKEVMVSAPLVVLLYDRTFFARSWRDVWHQRRWVHFALLSTWTLLAVLVVFAEGRGGSAGFGSGVSWWHYLLTQGHAVAHYLRLALWPHPLVFDYGTFVIRDAGAVAAPALLLLILLGLTLWALRQQRPLGLLGAAFFLILAPTSSIIPIATQTMSEHRLYLPLAVVIILLVLGAHRLGGRWSFPFLLPLLLVYGVLTAHRNTVYASEVALWEDTVSHRPQNPRAQTNLGLALLEEGRTTEAVRHFEESLRLQPDEPVAHLNLSAAFNRLRRPAPAQTHAEAALRLDPESTDARINLANALFQLGENDGAIEFYETAVARQPEAGDVHLSLATALLRAGRLPASIRHFEAGLRLEPGRVDGWLNLARAQVQAGQAEAAQAALARVLHLQPDSPDAHYLLGMLAARRADYLVAIRHFRAAVDLAPTSVAARNNLANALLVAGQVEEAISHYREILRQDPTDRSVQENLALALEQARSTR